MKNNLLKYFLVEKNSSIKNTIRAIDRKGFGIAFLTDNKNRLFGVVTDGDIRRAILRGININKPVLVIANTNPVFLIGKPSEEELKKLRADENVKRCIPPQGSLKIPIVDKNKKIKSVIFLYQNKDNSFFESKDNPKFAEGGIKKVLIVGGAGYLGSVLCRKLMDKNYRVRVFDSLAYGDDGIKELYKNKKFEFFKGDIRNISEVMKACEGIDAVIHLAAIVGDPACAVDPKKTLEINYLATKNIAETCKYFQINRFIFASTCSVYGAGSSSEKKLTEESPLNPVSLYAETKIECENSILSAIDENFSPVILRMATLYGYSPNMRFDLAVNIMTGHAVFDKKITVFGGDQWRPWLHVDDAAQGFINCLNSPLDKIRGGIFNVLSENYKIIEVAKIINSVCPKAVLKISEKITDKRDYNVSFDKISRELNYRPTIRLERGVRGIKKAIESGIVKDYRDPKYRAALPQI